MARPVRVHCVIPCGGKEHLAPKHSCSLGRCELRREPIALDGLTLRGSARRQRRPLLLRRTALAPATIHRQLTRRSASKDAGRLVAIARERREYDKEAPAFGRCPRGYLSPLLY